MADSKSTLSPARALRQADTHPLVLNLLLIKEFGPDYLQWEPETLWFECERTWGGISEGNKAKVQAVRTCYSTDQPYERWEIFSPVVVAFYGHPPRFDLVQLPSPQKVAGALDIMSNIREKKKVSDEVYKYAAAVMAHAGMVYGAGPLAPANKFLKPFSDGNQDKVREALLRGDVPDPAMTSAIDMQLMKTISVRDFVASQSRLLLSQIDVVG